MSQVRKCSCGRSETGFCDGSHLLTEEKYKEKKSEYIASALAAQFPGSMFSDEIRAEKLANRQMRPSLDLAELDQYIHTSFARGCGA